MWQRKHENSAIYRVREAGHVTSLNFHSLMCKTWEGNGTPLQCSCLENPRDGGAWWAAVYGVTEGWTWQSDFNFTFHFHALEKAMAPYSSVLAWGIPGTGEPGGLPSMGSHRVGHRVRHDWSNLAAAAACVKQSPHLPYLFQWASATTRWTKGNGFIAYKFLHVSPSTMAHLNPFKGAA